LPGTSENPLPWRVLLEDFWDAARVLARNRARNYAQDVLSRWTRELTAKLMDEASKLLRQCVQVPLPGSFTPQDKAVLVITLPRTPGSTIPYSAGSAQPDPAGPFETAEAQAQAWMASVAGRGLLTLVGEVRADITSREGGAQSLEQKPKHDHLRNEVRVLAGLAELSRVAGLHSGHPLCQFHT